jgi:hypothetical protein
MEVFTFTLVSYVFYDKHSLNYIIPVPLDVFDT